MAEFINRWRNFAKTLRDDEDLDHAHRFTHLAGVQTELASLERFSGGFPPDLISSPLLLRISRLD